MLSEPAFWVALVAMLPLMAATAYLDLKFLKIPNWLVLAVLAVFLITGFWGLPTEIYVWRLIYAAIAIVIGFGLFAVGAMGAGDAKMIAALVPFIVPGDIAIVLVLYTATTIVMLAGLYGVKMISSGRETGWLALDQFQKPAARRMFPMGLIFATTVAIYLALYARMLLEL